ncbi:MAG: M48 family metalloprotease [Phycisphaerales bacterium]
MTVLANNAKTAILLAFLFGLFVWVGSFWGTQGMVLAALIAGAMNVGTWWFSDRLAIAAMHGRQVDMQSAPELVSMVARLSERAGLPMPRVFICPQEAPNAFATGRSPRHAAVGITEGALRLLARDELEGVIGHELAHIRNRDTLTSTVAATIAGVFSMMAQWALLFGGGGGGGDGQRGGHPFAALAVVLLGGVGAALLRATISRSREYVADAEGAAIAGSPHGLVSALAKLEQWNRRVPLQTANPALNGMFIVEPWVGETLTGLFATHPPTERRIAALRRV